MGAISPEQHAELRRLVEKHGLSKYIDRIAEKAQSMVQLLALEPDDYSRVGGTRIGGVPDLPEGVEWPFGAERFMRFVAQVNLAEMPLPGESPLPTSGWLYFFLIDDGSAGDLEHKVIYHAGPAAGLEKTEPPVPLEEMSPDWEEEGLGEFAPYRVLARRLISIPRDERVILADEKGSMDDEEVDSYYGLLEELRNAPDSRRQGVSQLLGWSEDPRGDPARKAAFKKLGLWDIRFVYSLEYVEGKMDEAVRAGKQDLADIYRQEKASFERYLANKDEVDAELGKWVLLLELDSDLDVGMCWWDAGTVQFMIHRDELTKLEFGNTYAEILTS